jgi:hypothetical protein
MNACLRRTRFKNLPWTSSQESKASSKNGGVAGGLQFSFSLVVFFPPSFFLFSMTQNQAKPRRPTIDVVESTCIQPTWQIRHASTDGGCLLWIWLAMCSRLSMGGMGERCGILPKSSHIISSRKFASRLLDLLAPSRLAIFLPIHTPRI